ncbi:hypothetical protein [Sodalis sp. dw_96]|uniref:hypothetical protein n=1 Tax=Sodalis sp. dw_96 TaxID=2719794 RepID=UPI001BD2F0DE|nr:hypothetical protein [Sodalis sp. dw_96]
MAWNNLALTDSKIPASPVIWLWGGLLGIITMICLAGHFFSPKGWTEQSGPIFWLYAFGLLVLIWAGAFGLKLLLYDKQIGQYNLTKVINNHALASRQSWANRYLMVIDSTVYLPEELTTSCIVNSENSLELRYGQVIKFTQFSDLTMRKIISLLFFSVSYALKNLPHSLNFNITVVSSEKKYDAELLDAIHSNWIDIRGDELDILSINIFRTLSQTILNDWIKSTDEIVNILLVLQFPATKNYSELAAIFILVSDDWSDHHQLSGKARVYRTMDANSDDFPEKYAVMLALQTESRMANQTWLTGSKSNEVKISMLNEHKKYKADFMPEVIKDFERFVGKTGPLGGWIALGIAADIAYYRNENQIVVGRWEEQWVANTIHSSGTECKDAG